MGKKLAERQIVVQSPPQRCFDVLLDFESYPSWQSAVRTCDVISRDGDGRARRVLFELDAQPAPITYTADYSYERPHLLTWKLVDGDLGAVHGEFVLEDRGDGTTLATCSLRIVAGAGLPRELVSTLNERVTRSSVEGLKTRVENGA
jgi:hypothetical protein